MAHGLNTILRRPTSVGCKTDGKGGIGSRRIFAPHFKLQVLDSYRNDADCKGNQRATARKYGIHRRQIQKWLQCENNLRNSVSKVKAVSLEARKCVVPDMSLRSGQHRQQDDFGSDAYSQALPEPSVTCIDGNVHSPPRQEVMSFQEEIRIPVKSNDDPIVNNAPLDYTMHCRSPSISPLEVAIPMDLSLKRTASEISTPVYCSTSQPQRVVSLGVKSPANTVTQGDSDIWDLSTKRLKSEPAHISSPSTETQPKAVKLFKPYLDDDVEGGVIKKESNAVEMPPCCKGSVVSQNEHDMPFYNNNHIAADYTYSLHELQPKNAINYYYTVNKNYVCTPQCEKMSFCSAYDGASYLQPLSPPLKHRQCYSVDVKVSAIECYYQDPMTHGNEHPVVTPKFNLHPEQFPKWLKHEEELFLRDTNKFMHVVS